MFILGRSFSSTNSKHTVHTAKSLYKYLMRQSNRLPNSEIQKYYKHQIRQSFIQHSDETEVERVNQIVTQAVKDFDWILKKSSQRMENLNKTSQNMENPMELDSGENTCYTQLKQENFSRSRKIDTLQGPVSSKFEFFYAVSVFATRPHILNRSVKGVELILDPCESSPKFFSGGPVYFEEILSVPPDISEELEEPYLKSLIDELSDLGVDRMTLKRRVIGQSLKEYIVKECWDLKNCTVVIENEETLELNKEFPPVLLVCSMINDSQNLSELNTIDGNLIQIEVSSTNKDSRLALLTLNFYGERVLPKIIKWASTKNSSVQESHPNTAPGVPSTSLKYVQVKSYYEEYKRMKDAYFKPLQMLWTETTDPLKFISEEIGIAAYIKTYIDSVSKAAPFSFVDMGCGNGVLTFALAAAGAHGYGFDIRPRKLWDVFPQLGVTPDLRIQSFNPFSDSIVQQENLWLIGNHADELTPWISVMARKSNASGFLVIPCCLFDFHGKFQRRAQNSSSSKSSDTKSLYQNYIHYIAEIGRKCGYNIYIDKLRIPSTKRVCIIGVSLNSNNNEAEADTVRNAIEYANTRISDFPSTDDSIRDIPVFKPRSPKEKVNNLTQVDSDTVSNIVNRIFRSLVSEDDDVNQMVSHPEYVRPWNSGRSDLTLAAAADLLTKDERHIIQSQGKGLQTLMKNHNQVFRIKNGCVGLRRPILDDCSKPNLKSATKIRTRMCYFYLHHPNGCPLVSEICRFKHSDSEESNENTHI